MDIRKWFTSPKASNADSNKGLKTKPPSKDSSGKSLDKKEVKRTKRRIVDSDSDDEIPLKKSKPKTVTNGSKKSSPKQRSKKPRNDKVIELDSDDDISEVTLPSSPKKSKLKPSESAKPLKAATVSSFFGSAPIQRSNQAAALPVNKSKQSRVEQNHEDKDFLKTLAQLDETEKKTKSERPEKQNHREASKSPKKKTPKKLSSDVEIVPPSPVAKKKANGIEHNHEDEDFVKTLAQLDEAHEKTESKQTDKQKNRKKEVSELSKKKPTKKFSTDIEIVPSSPVVKKKVVVVEEKKKTTPKGDRSNYMSYLHREGPKALGSKEIPQGDGKCLKGKIFIVTGVLESIERDEAKSLIESCAGKVTTTLSKKTNYMVVGRDAGASKLAKAEAFGTTLLDEDGLLDLIRSTTTAVPKKETVSSSEDKPSSSSESNNRFSQFALKKTDESVDKKNLHDIEVDASKSSDCLLHSASSPTKVERPSSVKNSPTKGSVQEDRPHQSLKRKADVPIQSLEMWVDKYKPASLKQIIGQQGDSSNAKKLLRWLKNWSKNSKVKKPPSFGKWNTNDDGAGFKAALLSGSPGVGKTTTAHLVCKEAEFDFIEFNASDTRSKKSLQNVVTELLLNKSLSKCFNASNPGTVSRNHVIIMDEVDGMAGNEDRGGVQELIGFIKSSKIPLICICNDRNHPKIRSLSNYCFDLKFQKPRVEQIKAAMMSIAFKEGIKVSPTVLQEVITASNQDIRQVLHNLSLWSSCGKVLTDDQAKKDIGYGIKHVKLSPFDVLREVFQIGLNKKASISDKSELFFHDYSIAPLFVQENYVHVVPTETGGDKQKHLRLLSEAADSICIGDVIDKRIRSQMAWSLLPTQAIFASVIPGELLVGHMKHLISFPSWLGKNSTRSRMDRILQELQMHMRMNITGNKTDIALEYIPILQKALTRPLLEKEVDGIKDVIQVMQRYSLLREDFDSIIDLSLWPNKTDPRTKINTKVKSAFTRTYNKECTQNPYAVMSVAKKKGAAKNSESELLGEGLEEDVLSEGEEQDDSIENDAMIKVKKQPAKKQAASEAGPSGNKKGGKTESKRPRSKK